MDANLPVALDLMFGNEGGYSNRATDAGGPTKFGITAKTLAQHRGRASVTAAEVRAMSKDEAATIYKSSYWHQSGGSVLPAGLDYAAFDFGVNSGPMTAVKKLQKVLGIKQDGWVGPKTLSAVRDYRGGIDKLIRDYCNERMTYLESLKGKQGWSANGRGWTIRVTGIDPTGKWAPKPGVVGDALAMAKGSKPTPEVLPEEASAKAEPKPTNPWLAPDVILPAGGAIASPLVPVLSGSGPVQIALAFAILAVVVLGSIYAFRRIKAA